MTDELAESLVILRQLVDSLAYKPRWRFYLLDAAPGMSWGMLRIVAATTDSQEDREIFVIHGIGVPPFVLDRRNWRRWLLFQLLRVEQHELCEHFQIDDERPFFPEHREGVDPYAIRERGEDRAMGWG